MALIAHYKLDGDALDSSGNGRHGTVFRTDLWTEGKIGQCADLNGAGRYITIPHDDEISRKVFGVSDYFTISAWVFIHSYTSYGMIIGKLSGSSWSNTTVGIWLYSGGIRAVMGSNESSNPAGSSISITGTPSINQWHHIAAVAYGKFFILYINGSEVDRVSISSLTRPRTENTNPIIIGRRTTSIADITTAKVDDVRIYDHALSEKEIKELAKAKILHYKFDDFQEPTINLSSSFYDYGDFENSISTGIGVYNNGASSGAIVTHSVVSAKAEGISLPPNGSDKVLKITIDNTVGYTGAMGWYTLTNDTHGTTCLAGKTYTQSAYMLMPSDMVTYAFTNNAGITNSGSVRPAPDGINWKLYSRTFTVGASNYTGGLHFYARKSGVYSFYMDMHQLEEKPYVTEYTKGERTGIVHDCSGYDNHATLDVNTTPQWTPGARIGEGAYIFDGTKRIELDNTLSSPPDQITISAWVKTNSASKYQHVFSKGNNTFSAAIYTSKMYLKIRIGGTVRNPTGTTSLLSNTWYHLVWQYDGKNIKFYINGVLDYTSPDYIGVLTANDDPTFIGSETSGGMMDGVIDDVRVYATALSDADIKELYQTRASIDNKGNLYVQGINQPTNIGEPVNNAIINKTFSNGLNRYIQSNCQVTLTDYGYRIYRPPNLTTAEHGNTMYGGLKVQPLNIDPHFFKKGHTYKITFDVNGKSTNNIASGGLYLTNNMGWGGGGLLPTPRIIKNDSLLGSNFQGYKHVEYIFEIIDDVYKVCTSSYSSFVEGNIYPSYRDIAYEFTYANTGEMGTDIYITNFKIMDITNISLNTISDSGIVAFEDISELGPTDGLVAYYPLNGNVVDYSENGYLSTAEGVTITDGPDCLAYRFDTGNIILATNALTGIFASQKYSWGAWVRKRANAGRILMSSVNTLELTAAATGAFTASTKDSGGFKNITSSPIIGLNEWCHVFATCDGITTSIYVNGELSGTVESNGFIDCGATMYIGNWSSKTQTFNGDICDVRVYNRALTAEEVNILYRLKTPDSMLQLSQDGAIYTKGEIIEI